MTDEIYGVLASNLASMEKSVGWLTRSYARTIDVIVNKVFRSIDAVELEDGGTMIDVVNRAEKRDLVQSADRVMDLKSLRNDIVHEYETDDLRSLFRQTMEAAPELFAIAEKTRSYCARFDLPSTGRSRTP